MNGYGTAIGSGIGTIIPGVGTVIGGAAGSIFDFIAGGTNKGAYQGNRFIPGDIQSRLSTVEGWIRQRGLTGADVDQQILENFIYVEGGWQGNVGNYLDQVLKNKREGTNYLAGTSNYPFPPNVEAGIEKIGQFVNPSGSPVLIYVLIIGLILYFMFIKK